MSTLGPKYGISDVMLKRICRQLNIPTPPRGYWAKVQNKIRVEKAKLPTAKIGQATTYWIQKQDVVRPKAEIAEEKFSGEALQVLAAVNARKPIKVAKRLASPHPLIEKARNILAKSELDQYGLSTGSWKKSALDIRVSPNTLGRAVRIFDAIIKFFSRQDVPIFPNGDQRSRDTHLVLFGEKISFFIREPTRRSDHQLTEKDKEELKRWSHALIQTYDYHPTGCLTLQIDGCWSQGVKNRWTDGKNKRLEDQLQEFVCSVIKIADLKRTWRIKREEEKREWEKERQRRAERARLGQIELERREDLEKQAANWVKSQQLRDYIQAIEMAAAKQGIAGRAKDSYAFWMRWANAHADRLDPLTRGLPFEDEAENG